MSKKVNFYSGLSGLQLPIPKYLFPAEFQESSRLKYYASLFNSIEVNSSFYKLPRAKTILNWAGDVPANFKFTFKLWKEITHNKEMVFNEVDVENFMRAISEVGEKAGCLLIQMPPKNGKENFPQLVRLLSIITNFNDKNQWRIAIEFRNSSWYDDDVFEMVNSFKSVIVIQDKQKQSSPMLNFDADFVYVRFHGPTGNYRGSYEDDFLHEYSGYIRSWHDEGKSVFVYFNNTMGEAFNNLTLLNNITTGY